MKNTPEAVFNGIYCITAQEFSRGRTNHEVVAEMLACGVKIIQYREKNKTMREKYLECMDIRAMTSKAGAFFIVNDHADLALAVKADGLHIGQDDLPLPDVRKIVGPGMLIGVSTHSPQQAARAVDDGADYIGAGPVFPTGTKHDVVEAVGLDYLDFVAANIRIPFVAIGGIKEHNLAAVKAHGARCAAMVTEIVGARDIKEKIGRLQAIMRNA